MRENFTTEHLENRHRFDAWRDAVCSRLIKAEAKQVQAGMFSGRFSYGMLGQFDIANHVSQASMMWQRTPECIRRHPNPDFYLGYICEGSGRLRQNNNETQVSAGDMVIYDASSPFHFAMENVSMNIIHLPRHLIEKEAPAIAAMSGTSLDLSRPGMVALRHMIDEAFRFNAAEEGSCLTEQFANTLFTVISVGLNLQKSDEGLKPTLYSRVMSYMRKHLQDHDLSVAQIANAHHVSPRTLSRVFAANGTTPMNCVWHERLLACHKALAEGKARNITQVALDHGFSDMSHFSLAFRKAFGYTPSSLLHPASGQPGS
ncbi:helix-turn-helix domain-containing protein [Erwinia sp. S38]|uniref:helix-turn-helix domain-containing protein n=1 Tax=Erwinia sp. S38 TaxID=2769338 RepID=UPI00190BBD02|nr:helix-turn-helix domain-containing protein [Erwinia sp. S38]MBK0000036.1 helix-turn-helix domain-containing protein [Erwinia sp. S38]